MQNLVDLVRIKNEDAKIYETGQCQIQECPPANIVKLNNRYNKFQSAMNSLEKLQLRYSVLSLLSNGSVSLFNDSLINLVKYLSMPENSGSEEATELSAYILDQMTTMTMEYENESVLTDFLQLFKTMIERNQSRRELEGLKKSAHLIP